MENMFGKMEKAMKANLILIKSMATEFIPGRMDVFTEDTGKMGNNMGLQSIVWKPKQASSAAMVFGQEDKGKSGLR